VQNAQNGGRFYFFHKLTNEYFTDAEANRQIKNPKKQHGDEGRHYPGILQQTAVHVDVYFAKKKEKNQNPAI
jgi:hypothetical protein